MKKCKNCGNEFELKYSSVQMFCSNKCAYSYKKTNYKKKELKKIPNVSEKRKSLNKLYSQKRLEFLTKPENKICPIYGTATTDIHHKMGRIGYADDEARENNISLLIDDRYWVALSRKVTFSLKTT